ncbi:MAG: polysaccharide biosynthesis protein [Pseudonocardiales bacterium]|nr:polysaccharide biosynthesis protein [Pseudonocardiales bacterium]
MAGSPPADQGPTVDPLLVRAADPTRDLPRETTSAASTGVVGLGVIALGLGAYLYLALAARAMDVSHFARLSVVVTAVLTFGPGLFLPIEQETARGLAHRIATSTSGRLLVRKASEMGVVFACVATVALVAAGLVGVDQLLDGDTALLIALGFGVAALLPAYLSRGILAGSGHTTRYAVQLGLDGLLRTLGAGGLVAADVHTPWVFAAVLTAAPMIAVSVSMIGLRAEQVYGTGPDEPISRRELAPALGYLVGASLSMQVLANSGPIAVKLLSDATQSAQAGRFLAALVLARSPLFVVAALQATLVPAWAAQIAQGDVDGVRRRVWKVAAAMGALALLLGPAGALGGPFALRIIYGADYVLDRHIIVLLLTGTGLFCIAVIVGLALIALRRPAVLCTGWALGVLVFAALCLPPYDPDNRVAVALIAGALTSLTWFGIAVERGTRQ